MGGAVAVGVAFERTVATVISGMMLPSARNEISPALARSVIVAVNRALIDRQRARLEEKRSTSGSPDRVADGRSSIRRSSDTGTRTPLLSILRRYSA